MVLLNFEAGVPGEFLIDSDIGLYGSVSDNAFTYVSDDGGSGGSVAVEAVADASRLIYLKQEESGTTRMFSYIKRSAYTAGDHTVMVAYFDGSGAETIAEARWYNNGKFTIRDKFITNVDETAIGALAANTWYSFAWFVDRTNSTMNLDIRRSDGTLVDQLTWTGVFSATKTTINSCRFGVVTGSSTDSYSFDYISADPDGFPGVGGPIVGRLSQIVADDPLGGSVSLVQTGGTPVTVTENPAGTFVFLDPGGPVPIFDLTIGGITHQVAAPRDQQSTLTKYPTGWSDQLSGVPTTIVPGEGGVLPTIENIPAGSTLTVFESGGAYPARPTSRTDVTVVWVGSTDPVAVALDGVDAWDQI